MPAASSILIKRLFQNGALIAKTVFDAGRRTLARQLGIVAPRQICAYRGFVTGDRLAVSGRVLAGRLGGGPKEHDGIVQNCLNTWRRWNSAEAPGAWVTLRHGGDVVAVRSDEQGYYHATLPHRSRVSEGRRTLGWLSVEARTEGRGGEAVTAVHPVLAPGSGAEFGVISDLDDTVIHTGITNLFLAAKLTFLGNARTRKPLEGVAELYRAFSHGGAGTVVNPIFYISSSAWNLYDLLSDFLELNDIPAGPLVLRDIALDPASVFKSRNHRHKLDHALRVMSAFPDLPFVLVGDSGQQDAELYAEAATLRPAQLKAIYIRDVDPDNATRRDEKVERMIAIAGNTGVPMLLAPDSRAIARHAVEIGLIPAGEIGDVEASVERDRRRPTEAEQAVANALQSPVSPDQPD